MRSRRLGTALVLATALAARGELVERVLAVVDERPLCLSDVHAIERLDGVDGNVALARLVDDTLLYHEAFRMPQAALTAAEEEDAGTRAGTDAAMRRALRRRAVIRKYVAFRFRPQIRVDDDKVRRRYQETYGGKPDAPPLEGVAAELREALAAEELSTRVADWTRELREAAAVRYNPPE